MFSSDSIDTAICMPHFYSHFAYLCVKLNTQCIYKEQLQRKERNEMLQANYFLVNIEILKYNKK